MYDHRNLTPEQKKEILKIRKNHGYPLHAPPHPFRGSGYYFISAAIFKHKPIIHSPMRRTDFEIALLNSFKNLNAKVEGWVILPNHYHLLVQIESLDFVSRQLQRLHGSTSYHWNKEDGLTRIRKVWYHYSDRVIRNEWHFFATLNYIHHNPVKHNYCEQANKWMWSIIHLYLEDYGKDWLIDKWQKFMPSEQFGKEWDDL